MNKKIGTLITHGTDTLSWIAPVLKYSLKNLAFNVVITGSQLPMSKEFPSSDGYSNIEHSIRLLTEIKGPGVFVVFNNGKDVYTGNLAKIHKWDPDAFIGNKIAEIKFEKIRTLSKTHNIIPTQKLDVLYFIPTGGTIDSIISEEGVLKPGGNHVAGFINDRMSNFFRDFAKRGITEPIDSSDMNPNIWQEIAENIINIAQKEGFNTFLDFSFNKKVEIIYTNPLMDTTRFQYLLNNLEGAIIAGYGGGNASILKNSQYSILEKLTHFMEQDKIAVLSSQVYTGICDGVYENGYRFLQNGALTSADLSPSEAQIRLSYLISKKDEIKKFASKHSLDSKILLRSIFMSGLEFRNVSSKRQFERISGIRIYDKDVLVNIPFKESLKIIAKFITSKDEYKIEEPSNVEELIELIKKYNLNLAKENKKWALIIKPDSIVGKNHLGQPVDAAINIAYFLQSGKIKNVLILPLYKMDINKLCQFLEKEMKLSLAEFARNFGILFCEGGRESIYNPDSFLTKEVAPKLSHKYFINLIKRISKNRLKFKHNVGIFICLSHQALIQAFEYTLLELFKRKEGIGKKIGLKTNEKLMKEWSLIVQEIESYSKKITIEYDNGEVASTGIGSKYFSVHPNELKEEKCVRLSHFDHSSIKKMDVKLIKSHEQISKYSGTIENLMDVEEIEAVMLHGDEVEVKAVLLLNWAFRKISKFAQKLVDLVDLPVASEYFSDLLSLPIGLEITSSTKYSELSSNYDKNELLTEVGSTCCYYKDYKTGKVYRDYTFQFHPEIPPDMSNLWGITQNYDISNDGLKILFNAIYGCSI